MSRRRDMESHRRSLDEIRNIMNSMKNLSYMETRKLSHFIDVQHAVVGGIEDMAEDFLSFWPDTLATEQSDGAEVYLLAGSERGFCGDFNHALLQRFDDLSQRHASKRLHVIALGHKLHNLLQDRAGDIIFIEGAGVVEEVDKVLGQLVQQLAAMQQQHQALNLYVLYFAEPHEVKHRQLLPPFQHYLSSSPRYPHAPQLNLQPGPFILELIYHYLFAVLHEILYTSLINENRRRVSHLEGAVRHLEERSEQLHHRINVLRQEEIIEEIEVILLSAVGLDA